MIPDLDKRVVETQKLLANLDAIAAGLPLPYPERPVAKQPIKPVVCQCGKAPKIHWRKRPGPTGYQPSNVQVKCECGRESEEVCEAYIGHPTAREAEQIAIEGWNNAAISADAEHGPGYRNSEQGESP